MTENALWKYLDTQPDDQTARLALADYYQEHDDHRHTGLRAIANLGLYAEHTVMQTGQKEIKYIFGTTANTLSYCAVNSRLPEHWFKLLTPDADSKEIRTTRPLLPRRTQRNIMELLRLPTRSRIRCRTRLPQTKI